MNEKAQRIYKFDVPNAAGKRKEISDATPLSKLQDALQT